MPINNKKSIHHLEIPSSPSIPSNELKSNYGDDKLLQEIFKQTIELTKDALFDNIYEGNSRWFQGWINIARNTML